MASPENTPEETNSAESTSVSSNNEFSKTETKLPNEGTVSSEQTTSIKVEVWNTYKTAKRLGIKPQQVRILIRMKKLEAQKQNGRWQIIADSVKKFEQRRKTSSKKEIIVEESGMLEVSVGLTGVTAALTVLSPNSLSIPDWAKIGVYIFSAGITLSTLYTSIWFLAKYAEDKDLIEVKKWETSRIGRGHIYTLLTDVSTGPYWLLGITLILVVFAVLLSGPVLTIALLGGDQ